MVLKAKGLVYIYVINATIVRLITMLSREKGYKIFAISIKDI